MRDKKLPPYFHFEFEMDESGHPKFNEQTYSKDEFEEIYFKFFPNGTKEEYDAMFEEFVQLKRMKQAH